MLKNINVSLISVATMYIVGVAIGACFGFFAGILALILVTLLSYFFKTKDGTNNITLDDDLSTTAV